MGIGRAAILDSPAGRTLPSQNIFDRISEVDSQRQESQSKLNQNYAKLHSLQRDVRSIEEQPFLKLVNLNLGFAQIASLTQIARSILSGVTGAINTNDPNTTKTRSLDVFDDFLYKLRQQAQYSIHAQPVSNGRDPDDLSSDLVADMVKNKLGRTVYKFHALIAPWLGIFKMFFPYANNPILGLLPRLIDSADNVMGKLTNIFWNLRQVGKSFVSYDGKTKSHTLAKQEANVRELVGFYWDKYVQQYFNLLYRSIFKSNNPMSSISFAPVITHEAKERVERAQSEMWNNFKHNLKAITSSTYESDNAGKTQKIVGEEEPENQKWYVKLKILSNCLGLPVGLLGAMSNTTSIGLNVLGSVINSQRIRGLSNKFTDWANALMSLVYLTKEVPSSLNEYIRKKKYEGEGDPRNLYAFTIGALGMLNRIKILPVFRQILSFARIKPILDKCDNVFRHFFLLFFSYNRVVLHSTEKAIEKEKASHQDLKSSRRHDNLWSHLTLPVRVLMADDQVSY